MKRALILLLFCGALACGAWAQAPADEVPAAGFLPQGAGAAATAREDELYNDGTDALDEGKYQEALKKFSVVADMKGRRADAAVYWKAYAHNKLGQRAEALATIAELRRQYPQSKWVKDAGALELEIKAAQGRPVNPDSESDCELKVMALNSLMNSDEERAIPMIEQVLRSNSCPKAKDKALFVLAQSNSPRAQQALANIARGGGSPELQRKAIQNLGLNNSPQSKKLLVEIYGATGDPSAKRAVLHAFMTSDAKAETLAVARNEPDPNLRREAIHQLGAMDAHEEMHQMYQAARSAEEKIVIIEALQASDDVAYLAQIAKNDSDANVRVAAIHGLGVAGNKSRRLLVEAYQSETNPKIREAAVEALFINDADTELIELARKEANPQMKRMIVEKLSVMDTPKARDYMIEILNK